jgi:chorismate-pyruvate lyase
MVAPEIVELERTLLESPATVTHFIEKLTGEPLVADVLGQYPVIAQGNDGLAIPAGQPVTQRVAMLTGQTSGRAYVYAESTFVAERLPRQTRARLEQTSDPIGRVLVAQGLKLGRESLPRPYRPGAEARTAISAFTSQIVWSRAYRLLVDDRPLFAIREWFLRSVLEALARQEHERKY